LKPAQFDLNITRGDDYVLPLNVRGRDASGNKTILDLTGYTVEARLVNEDGTTTIITANWLSQSTGMLELLVARSVTANLAASGIKWYFALTDPSNRKETYMDGNALVRDRGARQR
jgi:hypothetical protein